MHYVLLEIFHKNESKQKKAILHALFETYAQCALKMNTSKLEFMYLNKRRASGRNRERKYSKLVEKWYGKTHMGGNHSMHLYYYQKYKLIINIENSLQLQRFLRIHILPHFRSLSSLYLCRIFLFVSFHFVPFLPAYRLIRIHMFS